MDCHYVVAIIIIIIFISLLQERHKPIELASRACYIPF